MKYLILVFLLFLFNCTICHAYDYYQSRPSYVLPNPIYEPSFHQTPQYRTPRRETTPLKIDNSAIEWSRQHDREMMQKWQRDMERREYIDAINGAVNRLYYGY